MTKKNRSLAELIEYAKKANPRFVQRFSEPPRGINFIDDEGKEATGSHYMEWCTNNKNEAIIENAMELTYGPGANKLISWTD